MNHINSASLQGSRSYQEDRHLHTSFGFRKSWGHLLAVMDGHGGDNVSEICAKHLGNLKKDRVRKDSNMSNLLKRIVRELHNLTHIYTEGSTLSLAFVDEIRDEVTVAVLGDSPVVVVDADGEVHVSPEHNARNNKGELEAVIARGGAYDHRGYIYIPGKDKHLQLTRALGDRKLDQVLSREPEVYTIKKPRYVLVASDGVFDPGHQAPILESEVVKLCKEGVHSQTIMRSILPTIQDNATAVVWKH